MAKKNNLVNLAKSSGNKTTAAKKPTKEEKLSPAEERDLKAKETVSKLLEGVELIPKKDDEQLIELDTEPKEGIQWLEEQVSLLSEQNEKLKSELALAKEDYQKLFGEFQKMKNTGEVTLNTVSDEDAIVKQTVIKIFDEIQHNYFAMMNPMTGKSNLVISPIAFLNRLIMFFPFLNDRKKY